MDHGKLFPGSSSLAVLLIVFLAVSLLTLFSIMRGGAGHVAVEAGGTRAYVPADFPEIEFDRQLLAEVEAGGAADADGVYRVRQPLAYEDYFPCTDCHGEMELNPERRELEEMHDDIQLDHGPKDRWCFDCHNPDDRDRLRLANGTLIGFDESYRLCGQCHGTIYPRLAGGHPRPPRGLLERRQELSAVRPLPQPPRAAISTDRAAAAAGAASVLAGRRTRRRSTMSKSKSEAPGP